MAHDKKTSGTGKGLISPGGDSKSYLGHFRNMETLKKGHNQGDPSGAAFNPSPISNPGAGGLAGIAGGQLGAARAKPAYDPTLNPVRAQRQSERAAGTFGTAAGKAEMGAARTAAAGIPMAQRRATAQAAVQGARTQNVAARQAGRAAQQEKRQMAMGARREAVGSARQKLQGAVGGVRAARQGLRSAIRGGDVAGAATAEQGLQAARGTRRQARRGLQQARLTR